MPHRLFIAVDLPDAVRRLLARLVADAPSGVRPVHADRIHLTLHFLGDLDAGGLAAVAAALAGVRRPGFEIDLVGTGVFPPRGRPSVVWAGVAASDGLRGLHGEIARVVNACGFATETRPWVPHVTLARLAPPAPRAWMDAFLDHTSRFVDRGIPVDAFRLYESIRSAEGGNHQPVATVPLGTPGGSAPAAGTAG